MNDSFGLFALFRFDFYTYCRLMLHSVVTQKGRNNSRTAKQQNVGVGGIDNGCFSYKP